MKWVVKFFNNNITIIIILIVVLLVAFYFNSDFGLGVRQIIEPLENNSVTYYGSDGGYTTVSNDSSGNITVTVVDRDGNKNIYKKSGTSDTIYVGPNGGKAEVVTDNNGKKTVVITYPNGSKVVYYNENINYEYDANNYDNYNHYNGEFENMIFNGPDGGTAKVLRTPDENTIVITYKNGVTDIYYIDGNINYFNSYVGPNGNTAKLITDINGKKAIEITFYDGRKIYYYSGNAYTYNSNNGNINYYDKYQPYDNVSATNYSSIPDINSNTDASYIKPDNNTGFNDNTGSNDNTSTTVNPDEYYNSLPDGIYKHQIPQGEEDKYILKSQVVPPVCPACPACPKCPDIQSSSSIDESKCPPCPPCSRCPEPSFSCEKIPNYNAFNSKTMPLPVLSDFSNFGM